MSDEFAAGLDIFRQDAVETARRARSGDGIAISVKWVEPQQDGIGE